MIYRLLNTWLSYDTSVIRDNVDEIIQHDISIDPEANANAAYHREEDQNNDDDVEESDEVDDTSSDLDPNYNADTNSTNDIGAVENQDDE